MKPQTPAQIVKNGHIATALRKWMADNNKKVGDINAAIGKSPTYSIGYQYVNGKLSPNPTNRKLLSKATGIPEADLMPRDFENPVAVIPKGPVGKMLDQLQRKNDVLSFTVNDHGEARIKFDVTLPLSSATPLLRMIMDAGIVFTKEE